MVAASFKKAQDKTKMLAALGNGKMRPMTRLGPVALLTILLLFHAGCVTPDASDKVVVELRLYPDEPIKYRLLPAWPTSSEPEMWLQARPDESGIALEANYRFARKPSENSSVSYSFGNDGSQTGAKWPCLPAGIDVSGPDCRKYLAGEAGPDGLSGAFFGVALISGRQPNADGLILFEVGASTTRAPAAIRLTSIGSSLVRLEAADERTRTLSAMTPSSAFEIWPCSIFTGEVTMDTHLGIPRSCTIREDDGDAFEWQLIEAPKGKASRFEAMEPETGHSDVKPISGQLLPSESTTDRLPFGFHEAVEAAAQESVAIREFVQRQPLVVGGSALTRSGTTSFCIAPEACTTSETWSWQIAFYAGSQRLLFAIEKTTQQPLGFVNYSLQSEEIGLSEDSIAQGPSTVASPGAAWADALARTGETPAALVLRAARWGESREFVGYFVAVNFPSDSGFIARSVMYDNSGTPMLILFEGVPL